MQENIIFPRAIQSFFPPLLLEESKKNGAGEELKKEEYAKMFQEEEGHWFFAAKRVFVAAFLETLSLPGNPLIFDAGCGTGANHLFLQRYGRVVSADKSADALAFCRQRALSRLVRCDLNTMSFQSGAFDIIAALDVLYHAWVVDDQALLKEFYRILKPGGTLLITDSAFPFLTSRHDKAVMARERYTLPALCKKLRAAGFTIRRASYMFAATFPLLAVVRLAQKFLPAGDEQSNVFPVPGPINRMILQVINWEAAILRRARLPFGSSLIILAEKPA